MCHATPALCASARSAGSDEMSFLPLICSSLPLRQLGSTAYLASTWTPHVSSLSYLQHQSHCRSRTDGAGFVMAFCPWRAPPSGLGRGPSRLAGSPRPRPPTPPGPSGVGGQKSSQAVASKSMSVTSRLARKGSSHRRSPNVRAGPELSPKFFLISLASAHSSPSSSTDAQWIPFFRVSNVLQRCLDCKGIGHHEKQDLHPDVLRGERNPQS